MSAFQPLYEQLEGILYSKELPPGFEEFHRKVVEKSHRVLGYVREDGVGDLSYDLISILVPTYMTEVIPYKAFSYLSDAVSKIVDPLYDELIQDSAMIERARQAAK